MSRSRYFYRVFAMKNRVFFKKTKAVFEKVTE